MATKDSDPIKAIDTSIAKPSTYARVFDESNVNWERSPEWTLMFLKNLQNYFNDCLQVRGHVFLNEVYDHLGFARTSAGTIVGWMRHGDVDGSGAGYIDFNIQPHAPEDKPHYELLDFNVDGIIYDKIEPHPKENNE